MLCALNCPVAEMRYTNQHDASFIETIGATTVNTANNSYNGDLMHFLIYSYITF